MSRGDLSGQAWQKMSEAYKKMGLSEAEIAERIICKTTKVLERKGNLGECDK